MVRAGVSRRGARRAHALEGHVLCLSLTSEYLETVHPVDADQRFIDGHFLAEPESCLRFGGGRDEGPTVGKFFWAWAYVQQLLLLFLLLLL